MKHTSVMLAVSLLVLPCIGCSSGQSETADAPDSHDTSSISETVSGTFSTSASADSQTDPTLTVTLPEQTESAHTTLFQGGIGGEEDAATPKPEFFSYMFQPDAVTARIAGGNYQTISCDLSEACQHRPEDDYYLDDYDTDGDFDLYLPKHYEGDRVASYSIFLWNAENEKFSTEPIYVDAVS